MKLLFLSIVVCSLMACKNQKKENDAAATTETNQFTTNPDAGTTPPPAPAVSNTNSVITIEGKDLNLYGSILVDKDKKKLQPGAPYRGMITSSSGPDNEGYTLRFVFDTKPGVYPVTGISYGRGKDDNAQQFGGMLGGEEKIYPYNVTITECKDLGDNGLGGHKWGISGYAENITIPAMGIMLMDKEKKHPKEIKIDKITFNDLSFDDNAEEMLKKALEMMKKKN